MKLKNFYPVFFKAHLIERINNSVLKCFLLFVFFAIASSTQAQSFNKKRQKEHSSSLAHSAKPVASLALATKAQNNKQLIGKGYKTSINELKNASLNKQTPHLSIKKSKTKPKNTIQKKDITLHQAITNKKLPFFDLTNRGYKTSVKKIKAFPVIYNQEVKSWVNFFTQNQRLYTKLWLKRAYRYFPFMEKILQSKGLPKQLVAMTLVESGLSPKAVSPAQAVGYWQFIPSTAKQYGLTINQWIDERQDFQKSTQSAAKYLYKLYGDFEDWLLVMSAYNMGEVRLIQLINKHQTKNFWQLRAKADFPKETALYVPKILAAGHIVKNPERYGWSEFQVLAPYNYDVFFIPGGVHLEEIALNTGVSLWKLKALNPELKQGMTPKSLTLYQMRLPKGTGLKISQWLDKKNL